MKEDKTCWECKRKMIHKRVEYKLYGISLGRFPALVCESCKEEYFDEETSKKICEVAKKKRLWGLQATTTVGVVGKTLDIRLPKRIIDFLDLKKGAEVNIIPEDKHKLVILI